PELFSGDRLRSIDAAVPHQLFATTGFASGLMRGLVGLHEPPATDPDAAPTIEPQLPAGWAYLRIRRLRWRDALYDVSIGRTRGTASDSTFEVTVTNRGRPRPLVVKLALPPGAETDGGVRELRFAAASAAETKQIAVRGGIELAPVQRPLTIGDSSDRLRIVSTAFERG